MSYPKTIYVNQYEAESDEGIFLYSADDDPEYLIDEIDEMEVGIYKFVKKAVIRKKTVVEAK